MKVGKTFYIVAWVGKTNKSFMHCYSPYIGPKKHYRTKKAAERGIKQLIETYHDAYDMAVAKVTIESITPRKKRKKVDHTA